MSVCIQDPRDYFDSQQVNAVKASAGAEAKKCNLSSREAYGSLRDSISQTKQMGLQNPVVKTKDALQVKESFLKLLLSTRTIVGLVCRTFVLPMLALMTCRP